MAAYASLDIVYRPRFTDAQDITQTVAEHGIIVFPGIIDMSTISALDEEFHEIIERRRELGMNVDESGHLLNVRLKRDALGPRMFPRTAEFFDQAFMKEVAQTYMGERVGPVNEVIFVNQNFETPPVLPKPPFALHFDRQRAFKYFVYLNDTNADNGAMWVAPGTMKANTAKRSALGAAVADAENIVPEEDFPSFPIDGPAGTLFVFDTEVSHKAGRVKPGHERRIMRGHTYFADSRGKQSGLRRLFRQLF